jgi:glycogen synthase
MKGLVPRKILMTTDTVGGVWAYSLQLAEVLAPYGIEIVLVAMGGEPSADRRREARALSNVTLIGSGLKLEWMPEPEADLRQAADVLLAVEAECRPDVVHINGYANAAAGFAAPVIAVAHSCVPSWWRACRHETAPPEWDGYRRRLRAGIAAADCVVAPTHAFLRSFIEANGAPARSRAIYNGRDPRRYRPGAKRPVALAAGRLWDEAKNIDGVCRAAALLRHPVAVAGDGFRAGCAPANVRLLGKLDPAALAAQMVEAAVFLAPVRYEPFGLAVLEAALSGCALVLGDIPSLRELWDGAARFVPPDDPEALAAAAGRLLANPELALAAGRTARGRALGYSAEAMGAAYVALYREALARAAMGLAQGAAA